MLLDDNRTVEFRSSEPLGAIPLYHGDVLTAYAEFINEVVNSLCALLAELLVTLLGTGAGIGASVEGELNVLATGDDVLDSVFSVCLLSLGESALTNGKVNNHGLVEETLNIGGSSLLSLVNKLLSLILSLLSSSVGIVSSLLCTGDLVFSSLLSSLCGSDSGGSGSSSSAYAGPVVAAEVNSETNNSVGEGNELAEVAIAGTGGKISTEFEVDVNLGPYMEIVLDTSLHTPLMTSGVVDKVTKTTEEDNIPEAVLFVTCEEVGEMYETVNLYIVECFVVSSALAELVLETTPAETGTEFRSKPLAEIDLDCRESNGKTFVATNEIPSRVDANTYSEGPVVKELVGFIAAELSVSVLIFVGFLCESNNTDKKGGSNCKNLFHTFFYLVN